MRSIGRFKSYWIGGELVDECGAVDLQALAGEAKDKLTGSAPEISETSGFPDFGNGEAKRKWFKLDEIVVVFADLKNSTALGINKHDATFLHYLFLTAMSASRITLVVHRRPS